MVSALLQLAHLCVVDSVLRTHLTVFFALCNDTTRWFNFSTPTTAQRDIGIFLDKTSRAKRTCDQWLGSKTGLCNDADTPLARDVRSLVCLRLPAALRPNLLLLLGVLVLRGDRLFRHGVDRRRQGRACRCPRGSTV